jgi:ring-1,2-phenylacetyl-CoA epoxidase subunit PaaB
VEKRHLNARFVQGLLDHTLVVLTFRVKSVHGMKFHFMNGGTAMSDDVFYEEYEAFSRKRDGLALEHRFSLTAPNKEMAYLLAKENFFRREPIKELWVVKREDIRMMNQKEREAFKLLDNKAYRETRGYTDLPKKWKEFKKEPQIEEA